MLPTIIQTVSSSIDSLATIDSLSNQTSGPSFLSELAPYVPLFQTLLWVALIIAGLALFSRQLRNIFSAIQRRIETGSSLEAGPLKLGEDIQGKIEPPKPTTPIRQPMEYKILNTLWTKQVNKWPDLSQLFTFRVNFYSREFLSYREAGNKLIGEGLIAETDNGQFYLTPKGYQYCNAHYKEFPDDQWWPEEKINQENLKKLIQG